MSEVLAHTSEVLAHISEVLAHMSNVLAHMSDVMAHTSEVLTHMNEVLAHTSEILAHTLRPVLWALSNSSGSLPRTNKARILEKMVAPAEIIPEPSATIIGGMS